MRTCWQIIRVLGFVVALPFIAIRQAVDMTRAQRAARRRRQGRA